MPLFELTRVPAQYPNGLEVMFRKDGEAVKVLVTHAAINAVRRPGTGSYVERFSVDRQFFLQIAAAKLDRGIIDDDGRVYVTAPDVIDPEFVSERL